MRQIRVKNATKLFTDEMLIYAISDISFNKPVRIKAIVFGLILSCVWALPLILIFKSFTPPMLTLYIVPVVGGTMLLSGPYFGGKTFTSWAKCLIRYLFSARRYYDGVGRKELTKTKVNHVYVVSREKDFKKLREMIEEEAVHE